MVVKTVNVDKPNSAAGHVVFVRKPKMVSDCAIVLMCVVLSVVISAYATSVIELIKSKHTTSSSSLGEVAQRVYATFAEIAWHGALLGTVVGLALALLRREWQQLRTSQTRDVLPPPNTTTVSSRTRRFPFLLTSAAQQERELMLARFEKISAELPGEKEFVDEVVLPALEVNGVEVGVVRLGDNAAVDELTNRILVELLKKVGVDIAIAETTDAMAAVTLDRVLARLLRMEPALAHRIVDKDEHAVRFDFGDDYRRVWSFARTNHPIVGIHANHIYVVKR